jgi:hypothetical protein
VLGVFESLPAPLVLDRGERSNGSWRHRRRERLVVEQHKPP